MTTNAGVKAHAERLTQLKKEASKHTVTLLYGAHDEEHNQAVVLGKMLRRK